MVGVIFGISRPIYKFVLVILLLHEIGNNIHYSALKIRNPHNTIPYNEDIIGWGIKIS